MKLISRTISERRYSVMCLNIKTAEVSTNEFSLGSTTYNTKKRTLEALRSKYETDEFKLVDIVGQSTKDALYVMTEEAFIRAAIPVADIKEARAYFSTNKEAGEEIEAVEI